MKLLVLIFILTTTDLSLLPFDMDQALGVENGRVIDSYIKDIGGEIFNKMENKSKKLKDVLMLKQMDVFPSEENDNNFSVFGKEDKSLEKQIMAEETQQDSANQTGSKQIV